MPASGVCARRVPNSTTGRPAAAVVQRAALDAIRVWKVTADSRYVSGSLGFDDGGADGERGFAGEEQGAFGDGEEIAGEAEVAEVIEEGGADLGELGEGAEVVDFLGGEAEVEEVVDDLGNAGDDGVIAIGGQAAEGEFEGGLIAGLAGLEIPGRHREFVEVGEKAVH